MATPASELDTFRLPTRIRTRRASDEIFAARIALAEYVASLPGIQTVEHDPATLPCRLDAFLHRPDPSARHKMLPTLLCRIGQDGIAIHGLTNLNRNRVIASGWGRLHGDGVLVFMPRNGDELETCCEIIQRAYRYLQATASRAPRLRTVSIGQLPRFSRTALQ